MEKVTFLGEREIPLDWLVYMQFAIQMPFWLHRHVHERVTSVVIHREPHEVDLQRIKHVRNPTDIPETPFYHQSLFKDEEGKGGMVPFSFFLVDPFFPCFCGVVGIVEGAEETRITR